MTGLDVLAMHLHLRAQKSGEPSYASLPDDVQQLWRDQAQVICEQMKQADGDGAEDTTAVLAAASLPDAVELVQAAANLLNERAVATAVSALTANDAINLLADLREARTTLGAIDNTLERHIYLTGEHGQQVIEGIGSVMVGRARDRKNWDERGVARAVIDQRMAQRGYEVPDDPWDVAEWLLEVFGVSYCRVTPLRGMGLEPDAFCDSTPGRVQVTLPTTR